MSGGIERKSRSARRATAAKRAAARYRAAGRQARQYRDGHIHEWRTLDRIEGLDADQRQCQVCGLIQMRHGDGWI